MKFYTREYLRTGKFDVPAFERGVMAASINKQNK